MRAYYENIIFIYQTLCSHVAILVQTKKRSYQRGEIRAPKNFVVAGTAGGKVRGGQAFVVERCEQTLYVLVIDKRARAK